MAVIFDETGDNFRNTLFKPYKSNRKIMPEKLKEQINPLYNIIKAMGFMVLSVANVEADDVIGTLALQGEQKGYSILISTLDKDMAQLVSSNIKIINMVNNEVLGPQDIEEKYGVPPTLISDHLALTGDCSDNIPGVPGIGKKTANIILRNLPGIQAIYDNINKISTLGLRGAENIVIKLKEHKEQVFLSYKLATIKTDVEIDLSKSIQISRDTDIIYLDKLFQRYEFRKWIKELKDGKWYIKN